MEIDEKKITSSSVPNGQYKRATSIKNSKTDDTSDETKSDQRTLRITISKDVRSGGRFEIDIDREEEKRFFSSLNKELKKIK